MADEANPEERAEIAAFERELSQADPGRAGERLPGRPLDDVAFHDFAYYEYLLPTERGFTSYTFLSDHGTLYVTQLEAQGLPAEQIDRIALFLQRLEQVVREALYDTVATAGLERTLSILLEALYRANPDLLVTLFEAYWLAPSEGDLFFHVFKVDLEVYLTQGPGQSVRSIGQFSWRDFYRGGELKDWWEVMGGRGRGSGSLSYGFEVFPRFSVNLGVRLVFRQSWRPLSLQRGEIVRTIPLGPGQRERVTTKIVRRKKMSNTLESITATETTTESTDSTKDSSEIVQEAASSFNWKVGAEVHGGIPLIGGSVNTSFGGSSDEKSRSTSAALSEAMRKQASKMRRESKVVVATEGEESFESESSSEIVNANNELAVTYEYVRLQQQYEVSTALAEVQSVLFVAERVPSPVEVDAAWVRRHDWILAKVLLDESYRAAVNELIQDADEEDPVGSNALDNPFADMAATAQGAFATFNQVGAQGNPASQGLSIPDIYSEPSRAYQQYLRDGAARRRANEMRQVKRERLFQHLRDNILHYCRAVWRQEDADQRLLRYKREERRVPVAWQWPLTAPRAASGVADLVPTGETRPLWELIDPTGPLGYVGNYAVFAVRPGALPQEDAGGGIQPAIPPPAARQLVSFDLDTVLAMMRAPYVDRRTGALRDPARRAFEREAARRDPAELAALSARELEDLFSYLPDLAGEVLDAAGAQRRAVTPDEWAEYLYRRNGTRRFLVDSNNLYLDVQSLETFKRVHRYLDVLNAYEQLVGLRLKNRRRATHLAAVGEYDPDVQKVIIVGDGALAAPALHEALGEGAGLPAPAPPGGGDGTAPPGGG